MLPDSWFPSPSAASSAVLGTPAPWTLDALQGIDPVLGFAVVMLIAVLVGEGVQRLAHLPRACGHMLVGALASPLAAHALEGSELSTWKPLIDLAIGALVFELGSRIRPRWLLDNPWLALTCLLDGALAGLAVCATLVYLGAPALSAAMAGAIALSTSPVIALVSAHELQPRGQVTERLLLMAAINSVVAMLAVKAWSVLSAASPGTAGQELLGAVNGGVYVVCGSFLLGAACGWALDRVSRPIRRTTAMPVLQIAFVIVATLLAAHWKLSPLLALLIAGVIARLRMGHSLTVEPHLGTAGAALTVLLFISLGVMSTVEGFWSLWPWVVAIILARLVGKAVAVLAVARPSGLGWRQAAALIVALQPMSSLAVLLTADNFAWFSQLPGADTRVLQSLLIATTLMQLTGPIWVQWSLRNLARECGHEDTGAVSASFASAPAAARNITNH
ncbi:cation:proton antiporter [soil metagenome]